MSANFNNDNNIEYDRNDKKIEGEIDDKVGGYIHDVDDNDAIRTPAIYSVYNKEISI